MSNRLHTALRGIGSVLAIAPGPGVAGFRERVRRVRPYRDDREALRLRLRARRRRSAPGAGAGRRGRALMKPAPASNDGTRPVPSRTAAAR
ncbi:MAG TPA: hypothetical protein PK403_09705 [Plasticicumulans sp.]|nr:hypothetical protein [Plasticicumulans sp.]